MLRQIRQIMHRDDIVTLLPSASVYAAAAVMKRQRQCVVLVMTKEHLEGILTEQDVVRRLSVLLLLGRHLQRFSPLVARQGRRIDEMDAVWDVVALAGAAARIADEPHPAVGEVQRMGSMAEAPDGQLATV